MDNPGNRSAESYSDYPDELPIIVRRSEVLNLMVMDRGTMQEVGRVERLWMYPQAHRVLGMICKGGGLLAKKRWAYKLPQVESLNQGNIWIEGPGTATSPDQVRQLETLIDHEIWVDGGDRLGVIVDCLFNRKTGQITQYLFVNNPLRRLIDAPNPLRPEEILSFGNHRALVSPQAVARLRRERPSLRDTFSQMKEQAKAEYEQVTNQTQERVRNWGEEAKTAKERLAEQATLLKQQAAERAKALQEQAAQDILPQLTEQAQELSQRVGEQYQTVQRRAQDFVEELPPLEQLSERNAFGPGRRGYDNPQGYDENWDREGRSGNQESYGGEVGYRSEPSGEYRRSRRSRYRQDSRNAPEDEGRGYDAYSDGDRTPSANHNNWGTNDPAELTWVDEAGDLPLVSPSQNPYPAPENQQSEAQWNDDYRRENHASHNSSNPPVQPPPTEPGPPSAEPLHSRDNPWGYADNATESDWDNLEFDQERQSPSHQPENSQPEIPQSSNNTGDSWIDQPEAPPNHQADQAAAQTPNSPIPPQGGKSALEDLEDDDPWI